MKGIDMFCVSQASTAIHSSNMDQPSSSSADPSCSSSSPAVLLGGRAIDRHNPIIRDYKRTPRIFPTAPCTSQPPPISPKPVSYQLLPKSSKARKDKSSNDQTKKVTHKKPKDQEAKKSSSRPIPDDAISKESTSTSLAKHVVTKRWHAANNPVGDFVTPPGSSRYLLGDTSYFDGLSDNYEPVFPVVNPVGSSRSSSQAVVNPDDSAHDKQPAVSSARSERPSSQVVVLRVSLHCKGCEGKVRKHLSRMEGVTSYSIDFKAKKVTIVGDVTPVSVLASVSKVKNAQFWTSTTTPVIPASDN